MTKRQDLYLQRRSRPEQSDQRQPDQAVNISHQPRASPVSTSLASRIEFPTMTATLASLNSAQGSTATISLRRIYISWRKRPSSQGNRPIGGRRKKTYPRRHAAHTTPTPGFAAHRALARRRNHHHGDPGGAARQSDRQLARDRDGIPRRRR